MTTKSSPSSAADSSVHLYGPENIHQLDWPAHEDGQYARLLLLPWMKNGAAHYIDNVETLLYVIQSGHTLLPVTVNEQQYTNSYVCSPYTHYIAYAAEELRELKSPLLEAMLRPFLKLMGAAAVRSQINRAVCINNWLLSTNLYPRLEPSQISSMTAEMLKRFPDHAILFRSINPRCYPDIYKALLDNGYRMIGSRQVYLFQGNGSNELSSKARWLIKRDEKLVEKQGYEVIRRDRLGPQDAARICELYRMLYLEKYSLHNPVFNERFFELMLETGGLELIALRKAGRIDAVLGYYVRNGIMTTPVFGYDTKLPQEAGLYRMLSAILIREAETRKLWLNQSSGAAEFKRNRGAVGEIEYTAVYDRHLPVSRRSVWAMLEAIINRAGVPLMQKRKL
ncbi:GNAT family N-acetyltransferase [Paenibacillus senegalensis]|uniref:GNAT family N-acetyltransferase n=1 Tax=Paenibacillus senegalensis TaxID=1465766 RepID=UPI000288B4B8|nr:GNAT family N-acetyltransferase [Paenibacillus senegalensis]